MEGKLALFGISFDDKFTRFPDSRVHWEEKWVAFTSFWVFASSEKNNALLLVKLTHFHAFLVYFSTVKVDLLSDKQIILKKK